MALCEKEADVEPGGGYEEAEWDAPGWGDCCRDWNPLRMWFSDWAAGRFPGLSFRDDDGPALLHNGWRGGEPYVTPSWIDVSYEVASKFRSVTHRESSKSPDLFRCARLTLLELNGEEPETGDINDPAPRPLDL